MRNLKTLSAGIAFAVCLVVLVAGLQLMTPEPAQAFEYCPVLDLCSEISTFGQLTLIGSCVHPDTFECFQRFRDEQWTECIRPCNF